MKYIPLKKISVSNTEKLVSQQKLVLFHFYSNNLFHSFQKTHCTHLQNIDFTHFTSFRKLISLITKNIWETNFTSYLWKQYWNIFHSAEISVSHNEKVVSHQKDIFHFFQITYFTHFRKYITVAQLKYNISLLSKNWLHSLQKIDFTSFRKTHYSHPIEDTVSEAEIWNSQRKLYSEKWFQSF